MTYANADMTLVTAARSHSRWRGRSCAVSCGTASMTWAEVGALSDAIAGGLAAHGVAGGDRVAFLLDNRIETFSLYLGAWKASAAVVPLSTLSSTEALAAILRDCEPRILVYDAQNERAVEAALARLGPSDIALWCVSASSPTLERAHQFRRVLETAPSRGPGAGPGSADLCTIVYTSGTTGQPKGVVHTHAARLAFANVRSLLWRMGAGDRLLTSTPLYHNGALLMLLPALINGGHLLVMERFDEEAFCELVLDRQVHYTFVVPTQVSRLLKTPAFGALGGSALRKLVCAGSPLPAADKAAALDVLGARFTELYGSTEGFGTTIDGNDMPRRPGSVGLPGTGCDLRIIGEDDHELASGEIGEIVGRSPYLMREYFHRPDETEASKWLSPDHEEYFRSGDLGRVDADGYLYVVGRKKDMLISGGVNVYPIDIETVLLTHPGVDQAAVVGIPHPDWGEVPAAAVVLRAPGEIDATQLAAWANERVGKHSRIRHLMVLQTLPRNVLGKVLKRELAATLASSAKQSTS